MFEDGVYDNDIFEMSTILDEVNLVKCKLMINNENLVNIHSLFIYIFIRLGLHLHVFVFSRVLYYFYLHSAAYYILVKEEKTYCSCCRRMDRQTNRKEDQS